MTKRNNFDVAKMCQIAAKQRAKAENRLNKIQESISPQMFESIIENKLNEIRKK